MKRLSAIKLTIAAMTLIVYNKLASLELGSFPLNAAATLPITKLIDGRIAPASTAEIVPIVRRNLSR